MMADNDLALSVQALAIRQLLYVYEKTDPRLAKAQQAWDQTATAIEWAKT